MTQLFSQYVDRFVVPVPGRIFLDEEGMLGTFGVLGSPANDLVAFSELRNLGSFCLLGEPGSGKTTSLKLLTMDLSELAVSRSDEAVVLRVSLAEIASRQDFRELVSSPLLIRESQACDTNVGAQMKPPITLVLDGIDECPLPSASKTLASMLGDLLEQFESGDLRVLLGCRTADYPHVIEAAMRDALGTFSVFELAPLTREDVRVLSASRGVDPEDFLASVTESGSGPLASLPLSLDLLLRRYQATGGLVGGATALYEEALRTLAEEPDLDRAVATRALGQGEQRLAVTSRLCSYLQLCGSSAFWIGERAQIPEGDLYPFDLAGGHERQTGGEFGVTTEMVDAALRCALFSSRGPNRLGPVHASFAAYLTARHLVVNEVSATQLRSLLTTVSENGNVGILPSLREVASWLVALDPQTNSWLVEFDLIGMATHAVLISDPEIRHTIVALLLADPHWALIQHSFRNWHLNHPGIASQLSEVLETFADRSLPAPTDEQTQLAMLLARDCHVVDLAPVLARIASRTDAEHWLRSMAASTATKLDRVSSAQPLRMVIDQLEVEPLADPHDEIRGAVLEALWPEHISTPELVVYLTRPRADNFYGLYSMFRSKIPDRAADGDLPELLRWAILGTTAGAREVSARSLDDEELVARLLERAFLCSDVDPVIEPAADLAAMQLRAYRTLIFPGPMDDRTDDGEELPQSTALRRQFTLAVLACLGQSYVHSIVWGWHSTPLATARYEERRGLGDLHFPPPRVGLVDKYDLAWFIDQALASTGSSDQVAAFVLLLRYLFDPTDVRAIDEAFRTSGTPFWQAFSPWFDAVPLGGSEEAEARRTFEASAVSRVRPIWENAASHAERVLDLYRRAETESQAYWELLYALLTIPDTGHTFHQWNDDISARPGVALLPEDWLVHLVKASFAYLETSSPINDNFLAEPNLIHWPIEAAYLAFALIARHGTPDNNLDSLSDAAWRKWAGSILIFQVVPVNAGDPNLKRDLLSRFIDPKLNVLPALVDSYIDGQIAFGLRLSELELLDVAYSVELGDVLFQRLSVIIASVSSLLGTTADSMSAGASETVESDTARQDTVERDRNIEILIDDVEMLTKLLLRNHHPLGSETSLGLLKSASSAEAGGAEARVGRAAARAVLAQSPELWPEVLRIIQSAPAFTRLVLYDLARDWVASAILANLSESHLAELWELMKQQWPYEEDVRVDGAHMVGPDEQAQNFRNKVIHTLIQRGTRDSVVQLTRLARDNPALPWLIDWLRQAEQHEREMQWSPLLPVELTQLLSDHRKRLVRSGSDLTDLIVEAIASASNRLSRMGQLLWNNRQSERVELWRPKGELDVGAWLSEYLNDALTTSGVVVNREVLVRQTAATGLGLAVDVQADAPFTLDDAGRRTAPARCRIELKGSWNPDLMSSMRTQLVDDYLIPEDLRDGVYLTAWFDLEQWNDTEDRRLTVARSRSRQETESALDEQAEQIRQLGVRVQSVVFDIPRPVPSQRGERNE
jgi:hypothetical protein